VSESQLARARAADPEHPERYLVGAAEALPLADASVDVALLMRSLHHAPSPDAALAELRRVVREIVYVAEPLPEGAFFELVSLVDDETEVRAVAQAAIARAPGYERVRTIDYDVTVHVPDLEALRARVVAADPARGERFAAVADELRRAFAPGDYAVPMRADVLRVVSSRP
jgi:SAM-dependent methyltransferase